MPGMHRNRVKGGAAAASGTEAGAGREIGGKPEDSAPGNRDVESIAPENMNEGSTASENMNGGSTAPESMMNGGSTAPESMKGGSTAPENMDGGSTASQNGGRGKAAASGGASGPRISRQRMFQLAAAVLFNGYAAGFHKGKIFTGKSKAVCVPVLNCYSCPGALGACPIGALQTALGGIRHHFPFYVLGMLMLFGIVLGRVICGLLCPFGLVQDLLHKIPLPKWKVPRKIDKPARYIKYAVLAVLVILLPAFAVTESGVTPPYFCQYICPAGTLEGGIPLLLADSGLRQVAGALFQWKLAVLAAVLLASVVIHRPFCRYLCPLGAFYSLFNRFSFYQMNLDSSRCVGCGQCEKVCPMAVEVTRDCNGPECIRCGKCKEVCPVQAISCGFARREGKA